ncbi:hypothetical protein U9M48_008945 [Paspalum notatum var. saurae]|uniref:Uncharacterized protein n=1 Tax=Paspalum notatum var. saurae TaxID=547442 RepID=A0AAQ3SQD1_PASNO
METEDEEKVPGEEVATTAVRLGHGREVERRQGGTARRRMEERRWPVEARRRQWRRRAAEKRRRRRRSSGGGAARRRPKQPLPRLHIPPLLLVAPSPNGRPFPFFSRGNRRGKAPWSSLPCPWRPFSSLNLSQLQDAKRTAHDKLFALRINVCEQQQEYL